MVLNLINIPINIIKIRNIINGCNIVNILYSITAFGLIKYVYIVYINIIITNNNAIDKTA
jgi:hypothetical protein